MNASFPVTAKPRQQDAIDKALNSGSRGGAV
jgi:hypothetical protein